MKFNYKNIFSWLLLFAAFTLVYSCSEDSGVDDEIVDDSDDDDDDDSVDDDDVDLEDYTVYSDYVTIDLDDLDVTEDDGANLVVVNIDDEITLTYTLSAEAEAAGLKEDDFSWDSSDHTSVNIDMYGKIIAAADGMATVTISYIDHENCKIYSDSLNVSVGIIKIESLVIEPSERTSIEQGDSLQLTVTISPSNATYKDVTWSSSNDSLAMVSTSGVVTAGSTVGVDIVITATAEDGYGATVSKTFTINQYDGSVGVAINACPENYTYPMNDATATISAAVPQGGDPGEIEWYSLNESVVTAAANGTDGDTTSYAKITFVGLGSAEVVARYHVDVNKSRTDTVTVNVPAGYWRETFSSNNGSTMTNYTYSTPVPSMMAFNNTTGASNSSSIGSAAYPLSSAPYFVEDAEGNYVSVPIQRYNSGYQMYYFGSVSNSDVGVNAAYPYFAIHIEHMNWRSYYFTGSVVSKNQTSAYGNSTSNAAYDANVYKTDRSPFSVTYLFSVGSTTEADAAGTFTEYIITSDYAHQVYHTHDISCGYVLPDMPIYGARSFATIEEYEEWATEELGGKLVDDASVQFTNGATTDESFYKAIYYADGTSESCTTFDSKQTFDEWKTIYSAWWTATGFTMPTE